MKKISWATHKSLFGQIAASSCLVAVSAGVVFGVSASTFKINYFDLRNADARYQASQATNYYSQNIASQWNMYEKLDKDGQVAIPGAAQPLNEYLEQCEDWWKELHGTNPMWHAKDDRADPEQMQLGTEKGKDIGQNAQNERKKFGTLVIDGSTHVALDRSFNQSLYNGIANFVTNKPHYVNAENEGVIYKPSQDTTQEFVNIYRKAAEKTRMLCLAGFNHVTPLNALGKQDGNKYKFDDENIAKTGMLLIDGDISNNQNIASVLFRSDQPAFLTAIATCMYFLNNLDVYHENYKDLAVAAYGGTAIPTVMVYMGGFQRGIEFYNELLLRDHILTEYARSYMYNEPMTDDEHFEKQLLPASKYKDEIEKIKAMPESTQKGDAVIAMLDKLYDEFSVKMIKLGDFGTHFSGSFAAGDAIGITKQYLNRGASAIIAVAGPQSLDSAQEVMNQNSSCIVIGVDCAMEDSDYQKPFKNPKFKDKSVDAAGKSSNQASNIIKFSAVKDMTTVSDDVLRLAAEGKNWDKTNSTPWESRAVVPAYSNEQKLEFNESNFKIVYDDDNMFFDVHGLINRPAESIKLMEIPLQFTRPSNKKVYSLSHVYNDHTIGTASFDASVIKDLETFRLTGEVAANQSVYFNPNTFNFDDGTTTYKGGFKYVDLSAVPVSKISVSASSNPRKAAFYNIGKNASSAKHLGVIKFGPSTSALASEHLYDDLFNDRNATGEIVRNMDWPLVEADPYKSICSFGFKTCGNIENGLISISWDGWPQLLDGLRMLKLWYKSQRDYTPFMDVWHDEAKEYCEDTEIAKTLPTGFADKVVTNDWKQLCTYDKESVIHEGYSHVMAILGRVFKYTSYPFPKDMTVDAKPDGTIIPAKETVTMPILDWLRLNMYFIV